MLSFYCDLQAKYRLFVSYCTSYYGSCLWDLQHKLVEVFYTTWRKAIRRLFGLPRNAHCNLLPLVAACLTIQSQLLNRCANFVNSCLNSNNCILKLLSSLALQGSGSQMANNCNLIKNVYIIKSNYIVTGSSSIFRHLARQCWHVSARRAQTERQKYFLPGRQKYLSPLVSPLWAETASSCSRIPHCFML